MRVEKRIDRALAGLRGKPGVTLRDGATRQELRTAEQALGTELPRALWHLLSRTNGLSILHGVHRILGVGASAPVDLVAFNRRERWKWAFPEAELHDVVVYGIDAGTWISGFAVGDHEELAGDLLAPETITAREWGLARRLERGWTHMVGTGRLRSDHRALLARFGELPPDMGVVHGPTFFQRNRIVPSEATLVPLADALVASGDLWRSALRLRDDHDLDTPERWVDEDGHQRWRWSATPRPLAQLAA